MKKTKIFILMGFVLIAVAACNRPVPVADEASSGAYPAEEFPSEEPTPGAYPAEDSPTTEPTNDAYPAEEPSAAATPLDYYPVEGEENTPVEEPVEPTETAGSQLEPTAISLDTGELPYSWQAVEVLGTPYDESQPPGPMGLPDHIQILFGVNDPADRQAGDPVMYIIPLQAYLDLWDQGGNDGVARMMASIQDFAITLPAFTPTSGMPALPYEEIIGFNDLATQVSHITMEEELMEDSATQEGYRFVGRFAQDPNPVTNQGLRYIYQGFTTDGEYLVAFFYPVMTTALPMEASEVPASEMELMNNNPVTYTQEKAQELNQLGPSDWEPDLAQLDALVASLKIAGLPADQE